MPAGNRLGTPTPQCRGDSLLRACRVDRIVVDELFLSSKPRAGGRRSIAGGTGSAWVVDDQAVGIEAVHHARLAYSVIVHNEWKRVGMIGLRVGSATFLKRCSGQV